MKKMSRKKLIEILSNKSDYTYNELAHITGYHPKSLIRINSMIKKDYYNLSDNNKTKNYESIVNDYLKSGYKTYRDFYNSNLFRYNIAYTTLCKILKNSEVKEEIVFIRKIRSKGNYYFEIIDSASKTILFTYDSLKNDLKSIKNILYLLLKDYGAPNNISFVNFFDDIPLTIHLLLDKYKINIIIFKSIYHKILQNLSDLTKNVKYKQMQIIKDDFYNSIIRMTISNNVIQFNNTRYVIDAPFLIKKNTKVILYFDNSKLDMFIKYNDEVYSLTPFKKVVSKRGNTKYS